MRRMTTPLTCCEQGRELSRLRLDAFCALSSGSAQVVTSNMLEADREPLMAPLREAFRTAAEQLRLHVHVAQLELPL